MVDFHDCQFTVQHEEKVRFWIHPPHQNQSPFRRYVGVDVPLHSLHDHGYPLRDCEVWPTSGN